MHRCPLAAIVVTLVAVIACPCDAARIKRTFKQHSNPVALASDDKWLELAAGCCAGKRNKGGGELWSGFRLNLDACKQKCEEFADCGAVDYGWGHPHITPWCFIWSTTNDCSTLDTSPRGCGSSGNNGVRAYKFQAHQAQCPEFVSRNTKGDCIDKDTHAVIDDECCKLHDTCEDAVARLAHALEERLMVYVKTCGLRPTEWIQEDGLVTIGDEGAAKICDAKCQDSYELSTTLKDFADLRKQCSKCDAPAVLEKYALMVGAADRVWKGCSTQ